MKKVFFLSLFLFSLFHSFGQKSAIIYVSPSGRDNNPGTVQKPFATLEKAKSAVRIELKKNHSDSIIVFLRKGKYTLKKSFSLDSLDSGTGNAPVIYSAYPGEEVLINGSVSVPVNKVKAVTDPAILSRLVPEARDKIVQVNLKKEGITDFGEIKPKGFGRPYAPTGMELFCNNTAMKLSRWPNDSLVKTGKVLDPGSVPRNGDTSNRGGKFMFDQLRPQRWSAAKDCWISGFFKYGYADDAVRVANLDLANKTITTEQPHMYGFESGKIFHAWYAFNLVEEIDEPGEYYIDRENCILYFYPPTASLTGIELSVLEAPLVTMINASYVGFRNITFEGSRGIGLYIERGTSNTIENCVFRNLGLVGILIGKGIYPYKNLQHAGTGEPASGIIGSLYSHMYDNTVMDREAGTNHLITGCHIYNTASGGIILGGGNRLTLEKGNNRVENCRIHDFNRLDRSYKAGVNIDGVGNIIRNCEIYNCPGSAILLHGNDHVIAYNNIHNAVTDGDDMGAIYYGRDPSELGNKIQYNFFHHIGNQHGSIMAIYHDDGACGTEVTGNVFYKAGSTTVMIGGGNDNKYYNNIFIDCPFAFHLDNRLQGWAKNLIEPKGLYEKRLQAVNYQQAPYAKAYPFISNYFEDRVGLPKRNLIERNVFVNVKMIANGKADWSYVGRNLSLNDKDIFIDADKMNFELKKTSEVFKLMPDFKNIPFSKIGNSKQPVEIKQQIGSGAQDRIFWSDLLYKMASPVIFNLAAGTLKQNMPVETEKVPGITYPNEKVTHLQAVGRTMAGIAPWLALPDDETKEGQQRKQLREALLKGIKNAVDPANPDYLNFRTEQQPIVDASYMAQAFIRAPKALWEPLDTLTQKRIIEEFKSLRDRTPTYNNWLIFSAITETFLLSIGAQEDPARIEFALKKVPEWYAGDGWYNDGPLFCMDNYNSFVIQPMLVDIYATLRHFNKASEMKYRNITEEDYELAIKRMVRYSEFLERFIGPDGSFPPFGRSITYRSGVFQALAQIALLRQYPEEITPGQIRSAMTAMHQKLFLQCSNFDANGWLVLGFCGHQPNLADYYISTGSLYMATLSFLPLGLPANDPFWTEPATDWTSKKAWGSQPFKKDYKVKY